MVDPNVILFRNETFYAAFASCDLAAMEELWSQRHPVLCIHPGWHPLTEREDIMHSWRDIFSSQGDSVMEIRCHAPRLMTYGDVHWIVCFEQLPAGWLVATNGFILEGDEPQMIHHQASQCMEPPEVDEPPQPQ